MNTHAQALDNELVRQFYLGNDNALKILIERHKEKIYSTIFYLVKDKQLAEDLFQDVFMKIIDTIRANRYNEEGKFLHWALRISHNLCVDYFRREKRNPLFSGDENNLFDFLDVRSDNVPDGKMQQSQSHDKLRKMIDMLPEEQREVIILRHYAELSFKEIAQITNSSINTCLGRMRYSLINLRKMIEENQVYI